MGNGASISIEVGETVIVTGRFFVDSVNFELLDLINQNS